MLLGDVGVPMIMVYWPPAILALIPIIFIEAWIGKRILTEPFGRCATAATVSNLVSTLVGIPVTWIVLATLEATFDGSAAGLDSFFQKVYSVTAQAPWLVPYEKDLSWMVPIAAVVLSVPFYLISVVSETVVAKRFFPERPSKGIWRWMWLANAASYAILVGLILAVLFLQFFGQIIQPVYKILAPLAEQIVNIVYWLAQMFLKPS